MKARTARPPSWAFQSSSAAPATCFDPSKDSKECFAHEKILHSAYKSKPSLHGYSTVLIHEPGIIRLHVTEANNLRIMCSL